jgi:hypothetical protein
LYNSCRHVAEDYTSDIKIQLHPTDRFYRHLDVLLEALDDNEEFEADLANALKSLEKSSWDAPFKRHGLSGHDFACPINNEFLLVFRRETDRDAHGRPLLIHFYLKTIERVGA